MIHLIQWLCPSRHCLVAVAYDPQQQTHDQAVAQLEKLAADAGVLPLCALCGSKALFYDDQPTHFKDMQEAYPYLAAAQAANVFTHMMMKASRN